MESQPQNPEFRNNPDIFHPCVWLSIGAKFLDFDLKTSSTFNNHI